MTDTDTTDRTVDRRGCERLASDGVHPLRVQLRHRDPPRCRRPNVRTHPRRQGAPGVEGLHVREGAAARLLPERSRRAAAEPAAPPSRRHLRGDRLGHRHPRGRRPSGRGARRARWRVDRVLRRRRAGQPPRRRLRIGDAQARSASGSAPTPSRRRRPARCWSWARCSAHRSAATSSTARSRSSSARTRGSRHGIPHARTTLKAIAADPGRAMIVIDPRRHRDRGAGRLPPAGAARPRRLAASPPWPPCSSTRASSTATWLADHAVRRRARCSPRSRDGADRRGTARSAASTRRSCAPRRAASRPPRASPCSRTSACR